MQIIYKNSPAVLWGLFLKHCRFAAIKKRERGVFAASPQIKKTNGPACSFPAVFPDFINAYLKISHQREFQFACDVS